MRRLSRRDFLKTSSLVAASIALAACEADQEPTFPGKWIPTPTQPLSGGKMENNEQSFIYLPQSMERGIEKSGWRIIGPGGGGAQYIPTIHPNDPDTALVACDMTGSYITQNGGKTWRQINFKGWVRAFAFNPTKPSTIYAGGTGLYRSEDSGKTWQLIFPDPSSVVQEKTVGDHADHSYVSSDNWPGGKVEAICVDPDDSRQLFIGINCGRLAVFRTVDGGVNWMECAQMEGSHFVKSYLDFTSPVVDRKLFYLSDTGIFNLSTNNNYVKRIPIPTQGEIADFSYGLDKSTGKQIFYITTSFSYKVKQFTSGVLRSLDLGNTWEALENGLDADLTGGQNRRFTRIATCPKDANIVYVSAVEPGEESSGSIVDYFGIFKSEDMGESWNWALKIGQTNPPNRTLGWVERDYSTTWGGAPFNLSVSPSNPQICYATDWGTTYRTNDGGTSWQQLYCETFPDGSVSTRGLDVTNIYFICFDPHHKDHLALTCTDIGAFHSTNGGRSWKHTIKGVPHSWANTCYAIIFDPDIEERSWSAWSNCHDMPRPKMFKAGKFHLYQGGICKSEDSLLTWKPSSNGLPPKCVPTDLIIDPRSPVGKRTLYVAIIGKGVYKSIDDGHTWQEKNTGITGNRNAWRIILLPDSTLYLLVCRGFGAGKEIDGAIYKSTDGAERWQPMKMPSRSNFPNDLAYDPSKPVRMYLACWPITVESKERFGGLYRTEDGGETWVNIFDESSHVYGVISDPNQPSRVFLTNFEGSVFRSDDLGKHWNRLGGYNFKWAKQPILDPYNKNMLYITTFGSSVWYGPADGVEGVFKDISQLPISQTPDD